MGRLFGSSDDTDEPDEPEYMPVDQMISLLDSYREDIEASDINDEHHERLQGQIEDIDQFIPGRNDEMETINAYPVDERTGVWLEWLIDRLDASNIEGSGFHADIETAVLDFMDEVEEIIETSTGQSESSKYNILELTTENFHGRESIVQAITYDRLDEILADFRADHQHLIHEIESDDGHDVAVIDTAEGEARTSGAEAVETDAEDGVENQELSDLTDAGSAPEEIIDAPQEPGEDESTDTESDAQPADAAGAADVDGTDAAVEPHDQTRPVPETPASEEQPAEPRPADQPGGEDDADNGDENWAWNDEDSDDHSDESPEPHQSVVDDAEGKQEADPDSDGPTHPEEESGKSGISDRLKRLGSTFPGLSAITGSESDTTTSDEEPDIELPDAPDPSNSDTGDESDSNGWKRDLLERDPDPEEVDVSMVEHLKEAGYVETDGTSEDIETFAGPHARAMMEIHDHDSNEPLWIGQATADGEEVPIEQETLFEHQFVVGKTGTGKSVMQGNQFRELMEAGYGGLFIDPNGDDSIRLMRILPEDRLDDVIWIEPGGTHDYVTGINFLEVGLDENHPKFDTALEALVDDLVKTIGGSSYWGERMDRITKNMIRAMNKSEHTFNLIDMYYILADEAARKKFSELIQDQDLDFISVYNREIAEMDDDNFDAILGRLQNWTENAVARQVAGFRDGIDIVDAVESDKIIVVRMADESPELKRMISMAVLRRVWAVIRRRSDQKSRDRKPFLALMDEVDNVIPDDEDDEAISTMLSEARKYRLSLTFATQHPNLIPDDTLEDIYGNTDTRIAFKLGHIDHARSVAPALQLDNADQLVREPNYHFWTYLESGRGETTDAFEAYSLPPYPPLRSRSEAMNLIEQRLREHGAPLTDEDIQDQLKFNYGAGELEKRGVVGDDKAASKVHEETQDTLRDTLLEAIYVTQIKQDAKGEFVNMDDVEREWQRRAGDLGYQSKPAQIIEQLPEELVPQENRSDGLHVRLTPDALEKAGLTQDTGQNASAGGKMHRWVLSQAFEAFTVWDCFVDLPDQGEGGELPDGLADLPIDPVERVKQEDDPRAFEQAVGELEQEYPALHDLTGGRNIAIEAETTTIENPMQTLTNLRKATNSSKLCVFAVKPPTESGRSPSNAPFDYWAQRGEQVIYRTQRSGTHVESINYDEITCVKQTTGDGHRQFYNGDPMTLEDQTIPVRENTGNDLEWWERDAEVVAQVETGDVITRFDTIWDLEDPDKTDFPAYAVKEDDGIKVYEGGEAHEYENMDLMEQQWSYFHEPFIPELEFDGSFPSADDFAFVVFPLADSDVDEPMIVEGDTWQPLLPEERSMPTSDVDVEPHDPDSEDSDEVLRSEQDDTDDDREQPVTEDTDAGFEGEGGGEGDNEENTDNADEGRSDHHSDDGSGHAADEASDTTSPGGPGDTVPVAKLDTGDVATVCAEIKSHQDPETVSPADKDSVVPVKTLTLQDDSGEIVTRLWGRHADCSVHEGMELFIAGASVSREVRDGVMQRVINAAEGDTVAPAPDSISPTSATETTGGDDPVAVTDGAVDVTPDDDEAGEQTHPEDEAEQEELQADETDTSDTDDSGESLQDIL
jgi:hypothetical protein